jgi:hypothetical protein
VSRCQNIDSLPKILKSAFFPVWEKRSFKLGFILYKVGFSTNGTAPFVLFEYICTLDIYIYLNSSHNWPIILGQLRMHMAVSLVLVPGTHTCIPVVPFEGYIYSIYFTSVQDLDTTVQNTSCTV